MGLLTKGSPLSWQETEPLVAYVKEHGLIQFIKLYHRLNKARQGDQLKWGDEVEYMIVKVDHKNRTVRLSCRAEELLTRLNAAEEVNALVGGENKFLWRPEYASYMIEGTPGAPYGGLLACVNVVESNMRRRRSEAERLLRSDEILLTCGAFPRLGCPDFTDPVHAPNPTGDDALSRSLFFPDKVIYGGHPRFRNLTRNIRQRRGEKVAINVPIFRDENTAQPFREDFSSLGDNGESARAAKDNHIYMDAMGFGMGMCCLQVTFQAVNVGEARWLYDQLTPITPVLLALSAATPIFRGYLADVDCRWDSISASVDDRTAEERGVVPSVSRRPISKSRYDTTDMYIYPCSVGYNDVAVEYDEEHYQKLLQGGIDSQLAKHIAHLFIRDPLQVYQERVEQDDELSSEHFETIQSSNWCNMRFKPPPTDGHGEIGWRIEFRPTEVQLTEFENAAYTCFIALLTRVIISFRLTFLIPISKVGENMKRAQRRDAISEQRFYFRSGLVTCNTPPEATRLQQSSTTTTQHDDEHVATGCPTEPTEDVIEMSIDEIINGKGNDFPGLVTLIRQYLDSADVDVDTRCTVTQYLTFIEKRAKGEVWTLARWMRDFVHNHAEYKKDSVVSDSIAYDLVVQMDALAKGKTHDERLLGNYRVGSSRTDRSIPSAVRKGEEALAINRMVTDAKRHRERKESDPSSKS